MPSRRMIAGAGRSRGRSPYTAAAIALAFIACQGTSGPTTPEQAQELLRSAIDAHGGSAALAPLDNVRMVSQGRFGGVVQIRRTVHYRAPNTWAMTVEFPDGGVMRFGVSGDRCWRSERHLTTECSDGDRSENALIGALFTAPLLHHIDPAAVEPAGTVAVHGKRYPAVRAGRLTLAFDPVSHRVTQARVDDRVETFSDYRRVGNALIPGARVITRGGATDIEETWTEIVPGGADPEALRVPELPHEGLTVDLVDPPRPVAWVEVADLGNLRGTIARLDEFVVAHGRRVSHSDGVVLTAPHDGDTAAWRVAIAVEGGEPLLPTVENGVHLETWPATRVVGSFYRGDPLYIEGWRAAVRSALRERGVEPADGARWQVLFPLDALDHPAAEQLSFVRIPVGTTN